ncbi:UEV_domain-containing protein [Hexamita inflata]|uniref:UEV domain-containing protein n=1 Tax=Hexamita inflata TaxID=28002 RepID=A0AA86NDR8_9EUKA|nr:UEV domain-containing protein [Hexamita inflata]
MEIKKHFPTIYQNYKNFSSIQRDIDAFSRTYPGFKLGQGALQEGGQQVPCIALMGQAYYTYQQKQYPVDLVFYFDYSYPQTQPKVLIQAKPGQTQIRPDGMYILPSGAVKDFQEWVPSFTILNKMQLLLNHFSKYPPLCVAQPNLQSQSYLQQMNSMNPSQSMNYQLPGQMNAQLPQQQTIPQAHLPGQMLLPGMMQQQTASALPSTNQYGLNNQLVQQLSAFKQKCAQILQQNFAEIETVKQSNRQYLQKVKERNTQLNDETEQILQSLNEDKQQQVQVFSDADDYEVAEAAKEFMDQVQLKRIQFEARKKTMDWAIQYLAENQVKVETVMEVIKQLDDVKECEMLTMIK